MAAAAHAAIKVDDLGGQIDDGNQENDINVNNAGDEEEYVPLPNTQPVDDEVVAEAEQVQEEAEEQEKEEEVRRLPRSLKSIKSLF